MDEKEFIGEVSKNSQEMVKVHVQTYKGKPYVDARIFIQGDDGSVIATKKGLCLSPDVCLEVLPLLSEAQEKAAAIGGEKG